MLKIYCFGNPLVKDDRIPFEILPFLKKEFPSIKFIEANSPDDIEEEKEINIIDTVYGINSVRVIEDIDFICNNKTCTLHDFDLGMTLKLMKKMNKIKRVRIIGIPVNYRKIKVMNEVKDMIEKEIIGR